MEEEPSTVEEAKETAGEIENEKSFINKTLGGSFVFRLPFAMDELNVLRRRVQIAGIPEDQAGSELIAISTARAMYEQYVVHAPHGFNINKMRSWTPLLRLMTEVSEWHEAFRQSLGGEEE